MPATYIPHSADKTTELDQVRALSSAERSYLQTFPKDFKFEGTRTTVEQQIGNAVPVKMAEYVAKHIYSNF